MNLNTKQIETKIKIDFIARILDVDPKLAIAIAFVESSLGLNQKSPTGCRGVFQMSSIAMTDLLYSMEAIDDDLIDIVCGVSFIRLLLKRHKDMRKAIEKFCDPADKSFYYDKVMDFYDRL